MGARYTVTRCTDGKNDYVRILIKQVVHLCTVHRAPLHRVAGVSGECRESGGGIKNGIKRLKAL
jgi:hypothetical protein